VEPDGPERRANYLIRHWRGELSLPIAYWVNLFLVNVVLLVLEATLQGFAHEAGPVVSGLLALGFYSATAIVTAWQLVGVWRSARAHPSRGGSRGWAVLAQIVAMLAVVRLFNLVNTQWPVLQQAATLIIHGDTMRAAELRVLNHGTEVEVAGGLSFGTAKRLETLLKGNSTVRLVQLNNIGGWIAEGELLQEIIETRGLATYTARECDSACLFAFMGGKDRYLGTHGRLGFHEASIAGVGGRLSRSGTDRFRSVFLRKGVSSSFVDRALSTPAASIWYPTWQELLDAHVITAVVDDSRYAMTGISGWTDRAQLEAQFRAVPLFATLQKLEPQLFTQFQDAFVTGIQQGWSQAEVTGRIRPAIIDKVVPKYLKIGPDTPLVAYWRVDLMQLRQLQAIDPKYCTALLFPGPGVQQPSLTGLLPKASLEADTNALNDLLVASAASPATTPPADAVKQELIEAMRRADRRIPGTITRVAAPQKSLGHPKELCESILTFYDEILALPPSHSGPLLRYLASAN
jgi:hypothetical protein